jgi:hypothetical protein
MVKKIEMEIDTLKGLVMAKVARSGEDIFLTTDDGRLFVMGHEQECCESVEIESIVGDLEDLVGSPILVAEESVSHGGLGDFPEMRFRFVDDEATATWTFYKIATVKGWVDIRWFGASNGYYSEKVSIVEIVNT